MSKLLAVVYSYCELGTQCQRRINNLKFFIKHGMILDGTTNYYFIINGHKLSVDIPKHESIKIFKRDNKGFDFGGYSQLIDFKVIDIDKYTNFFFLNDSVMGPFMFDWAKEHTDWRKVFVNLLDKETKIAGPTINNYSGRAHINSECFIVDRKGLDIGIESGVFSNKWYTTPGIIKDTICQECEVKYSQEILDRGFNIKCLMLSYKDIDFREKRGDSSLNANRRKGGDPFYNNQYFGFNVNPYEIIFFKSNRGVGDNVLKKYVEWIER